MSKNSERTPSSKKKKLGKAWKGSNKDQLDYWEVTRISSLQKRSGKNGEMGVCATNLKASIKEKGRFWGKRQQKEVSSQRGMKPLAESK